MTTTFFLIPHGLANALLLPEVVKFNARDPRTAERYAQLARVTGIADFKDDAVIGTAKFIAYIYELKEQMNMESSIIAWGLDRDKFEAGKRQLAANALVDTCTQSTPTMPTVEEVIEILNAISK